jgi:hypothetical protein
MEAPSSPDEIIFMPDEISYVPDGIILCARRKVKGNGWAETAGWQCEL